jgi:hypothetical protein
LHRWNSRFTVLTTGSWSLGLPRSLLHQQIARLSLYRDEQAQTTQPVNEGLVAGWDDRECHYLWFAGGASPEALRAFAYNMGLPSTRTDGRGGAGVFHP